jgi:hypothetical protein
MSGQGAGGGQGMERNDGMSGQGGAEQDGESSGW